MDDDDDVWGECEDIAAGAAGAGADMAAYHRDVAAREWQRMADSHHKMAYSDAVTSAREAAVQTGFELGLQQAVACGRQLGRLEGICRARIALAEGRAADIDAAVAAFQRSLQELLEADAAAGEAPAAASGCAGMSTPCCRTKQDTDLDVHIAVDVDIGRGGCCGGANGTDEPGGCCRAAGADSAAKNTVTAAMQDHEAPLAAALERLSTRPTRLERGWQQSWTEEAAAETLAELAELRAQLHHDAPPSKPPPIEW